jgi:hypothetical protein
MVFPAPQGLHDLSLNTAFIESFLTHTCFFSKDSVLWHLWIKFVHIPHLKHCNIAVCPCSIAAASRLQEKYTRIYDVNPRNQLNQHVQFEAKIPVLATCGCDWSIDLYYGLLKISLFCCAINILPVLPSLLWCRSWPQHERQEK